MNYRKIYINLIEKRLIIHPLGYVEKHHIIPKSLGGSDNTFNIVNLTAREHFIAHLLLSKMYIEGSLEWIKMQKALIRMFSKNCIQERYSPSKWYAYVKEKVATANHLNQLGKGNSQYGKIWIYNEFLNLSVSIPRHELPNYIQNDWKVGRVIKWNNRKRKAKKYISPEQKFEEELKKNRHKERKQQNVELYTSYYLLYDKVGWKKFISITGYNKSKPNLVKQFKRYVKEFIPQNGKKRGK